MGLFKTITSVKLTLSVNSQMLVQSADVSTLSVINGENLAAKK